MTAERGFPTALAMGVAGLYRLKPPVPLQTLPPAGGRLAHVDCSAVQSKADLLAAMSHALDAPSPLPNWDALLDALRDLSWLDREGRTLIAITGLEALAGSDPDAYATLLAVLVDAAAFWCRHPEQAPLLVVEQPPLPRTDP